MAKLNFQQPLLQSHYLYHMILKKHYLLLLMLKIVVLLNIFEETVILFFQDSLINCSKQQHLFKIEIFCNIINVFTHCNV